MNALSLSIILVATPAFAGFHFGKCSKAEYEKGCYTTIDAWCDPWNTNDSCIYQCECPNLPPPAPVEEE